MKTGKRPQDSSIEERLTLVIACGALDAEGISEYCRENGLYPHHVEQRKTDFVEATPGKGKTGERTEARQLKHESKTLKKERLRKEKALAESATLVVL